MLKMQWAGCYIRQCGPFPDFLHFFLYSLMCCFQFCLCLCLCFAAAFSYAIQNLLMFHAFHHLDFITYHLLNQTKLLSTALCVYLLMGTHSPTRNLCQSVALPEPPQREHIDYLPTCSAPQTGQPRPV